MDCRFPDHHHAPRGSGGGLTDNVASAAGVAVGVVGGALALMWALHVLLIIAVCVGFATMAAAGGYATVRLRGRRRRALLESWPPGYLPPSAPGRGALDAGPEVHLHLPPGASADDAAALAAYLAERAARQRRALPRRGVWGGGR